MRAWRPGARPTLLGWAAVDHSLIDGQLFMETAFPSGGSFDPGIANMRTAPHGVRYAIDEFRSRAGDEAEHDGTVALQLQIVDPNAG
jgi:hypothetical protein